jgi:hypothetical protein
VTIAQVSNGAESPFPAAARARGQPYQSRLLRACSLVSRLFLRREQVIMQAALPSRAARSDELGGQTNQSNGEWKGEQKCEWTVQDHKPLNQSSARSMIPASAVEGALIY